MSFVHHKQQEDGCINSSVFTTEVLICHSTPNGNLRLYDRRNLYHLLIEEFFYSRWRSIVECLPVSQLLHRGISNVLRTVLQLHQKTRNISYHDHNDSKDSSCHNLMSIFLLCRLHLLSKSCLKKDFSVFLSPCCGTG